MWLDMDLTHEMTMSKGRGSVG